MSSMTRRDAIRAAGLTALGLGLAGCGRGFGGGQDSGAKGTVTLQMVWWGDATRAALTQKALDLFQKKNPSITVKTEYQDSAPYKDKLATRMAAGDPPDLMAQRMDGIREYADRGTLLDLAAHKDKLDLSGVSETVRQLATVGGKTFGIASGLNAIGFIINKKVTDQVGVAIPDGDTWSWDDLARFAADVSAKTGRKIWGTGYDITTLANLVTFTRQRGEDFYTDDGKIGAGPATVQEWFDMADRMRAQGGFPPATFFEKIGASADQSFIAKGTIASQIIPTNNFLVYQKACGGTLRLLRMPGESTSKRRGQSIDTPYFWSIAEKSKHPEEALKLLDFLINDVEASKLTGTTRGVPANQKVAQEIRSTLEKDDQVATDYLIGLQGLNLPPSHAYPPGSTTVQSTLTNIATEVAFKRQTSADGARNFIAACTKALGAK
jgi:multiple sugar transport system substrate-binding protein